MVICNGIDISSVTYDDASLLWHHWDIVGLETLASSQPLASCKITCSCLQEESSGQRMLKPFYIVISGPHTAHFGPPDQLNL